MNDTLKDVLSPEDYQSLQLDNLIQEIESGKYMPDYLSWLSNKKPELTLTWKHIQYLGDYIQKVIDGDIKKLMVSMHPRIGKSTLVTLGLPVYYLDKNPRHKIILSAYNQTLANTFSVKCRSFAEKVGIVLNPNKRARDEWETLDYEGGVRAVGVGAGIAGYGANLIILDDPIRNNKDANSPTVRKMIYDWYTSDIYTRLERNASIIGIMTRWHESDLFGTILQNEGEYSESNPNGWHVVNLPALAEKDDPLGRLPGEALCPERFNEQQLLAIKQVLGRKFESLYQGRPTALEGGIVKRSWFKFVEFIPKEEKITYCRFWDKAASEAVTSDYTATVLIAYSNSSKNIYVVEASRFKASTYERDQRMLETARKDYIKYGNVYIRHEIEPGASGIDSANMTSKLLQGYPVRGIRSRKNKILRFEPFAAQLEAGNVYLLKAPWNREYTEELCIFPNGKHDHWVDCSGGAFNDVIGGNSFIQIGNRF